MTRIAKNKYLNWFLLSCMGLVVILMLSSFVMRIFVSPSVENTYEDVQHENKMKIIQVNILNACSVPGIANKAKVFMRKRGFDVVEIGNYSKNLDKSLVLDRTGNLDASLKVAYAMGISDTLVSSKQDTNLYLQSTIVIGKDFETLKAFSNE